MWTASSSSTACWAADAREWPCTKRASAIWSPTRITGFSAVIGSWKMREIRAPRTSRISRSPSCSRLPPSNRSSPLVIRPPGGSSRRIENAVIDLPLPDSPTRPSVSPGRIWKLTSFTAGLARPAGPNSTVRCRTSSSGAPGGATLVSDTVGILMLSEHSPERVGNLAQRGQSLHRGDDRRDEVVAAACRRVHTAQRLPGGGFAARGAQGPQSLHLGALDAGVDAEHVHSGRGVVGEPVHAHHGLLAGV